MPKPDPALLDPSRYRFAHDITTRFADVDPNQHLNNVAMASLLEDVRVRFNHQDDFGPWGQLRAMVASVAIDYIAQAYYPQPLRGLAAIERIGSSSWTVVQLLTQGDRVCVFARSTIVRIADGRPTPLEPIMRQKLAEWQLQG